MAASLIGPAEPVAAKALGAWLLQLRRSRGLSLRGVAVRLGCHHTLVLRWEQGLREPAVHDLVAIARLFRVEVDDILACADRDQGRVASSRAHGFRSRQRLASRLCEARTQRRLRLWDVYTATGITGRRLRTIEAGADPSLCELRLLATLYERRPQDLLANQLTPAEPTERHSASTTASGSSLADTTKADGGQARWSREPVDHRQAVSVRTRSGAGGRTGD